MKKNPNPHPITLILNWEAPYIPREQESLDRATGGMIKAKTLANLDSKGEGPDGRVKCGRKVFYPTGSFLSWMEKRITSPNTQNKNKEQL